jgi:hypothetical protein
MGQCSWFHHFNPSAVFQLATRVEQIVTRVFADSFGIPYDEAFILRFLGGSLINTSFFVESNVVTLANANPVPGLVDANGDGLQDP